MKSGKNIKKKMKKSRTNIMEKKNKRESMEEIIIGIFLMIQKRN